MKYILTCPYNATQIAKKELAILWYKATILSQNTLSFEWDESAIARVNLHSRVGNKLFLVLTNWPGSTFEELFSTISTVDWNKYIIINQPVLTSALVRNSLITSIPSIQGITKKAVTKKLTWNDDRWEEDSNLQAVDILITIDKDIASVLINTTWESLHERWYRKHAWEAPLKENLAAALILSSGWKFSTPLVDPFCGAWTIAIEAALIAKNIAPWFNRWFAFHGFDRYPNSHFKEAVTIAEAQVMTSKEHTIIGHDINPTMIEISKDNAKNAWVGSYIEFSQRDFMQTSVTPEKISESWKFSIVTNPPYWERLQLAESMNLYKRLVTLYENNQNINGWFISNAPDIRTVYKRDERKETTYYNGPLECRFYKIARL